MKAGLIFSFQKKKYASKNFFPQKLIFQKNVYLPKKYFPKIKIPKKNLKNFPKRI